MARHISIVAPVSALQLEKEAIEVLRGFQPECLQRPISVDVETFFEIKLPKLAGVTTDYRRLEGDMPGIFGWTDSQRMEVIIAAELIDSPLASQRRRCRATIVHETDHAMRHIPQFREKAKHLHSVNGADHGNHRLYRQEDVPAFRNPEWQSWRWGRAFIMPFPVINSLNQKGCGVDEMADIFDVNPAFVRVRLNDVLALTKN